MQENKKTTKGANPSVSGIPDLQPEALREGHIRKQLLYIQQSLAAPKDMKNTEKQFSYRTAEGILAAVKPLLRECGCTLTFNETLMPTEHGVYVVSTACLTNLSGESVSASAFAREDTRLPGMCSAQISGSCISYARKYAAGGLLAIDNTRLVDPIELDSFSPSAVEELKRAEDSGFEIPVSSLVIPVNATSRPILRAGQSGWENEVALVCSWSGTEDEYVRDLSRRWIVGEEDMLVLLSRRKAPFADK